MNRETGFSGNGDVGRAKRGGGEVGGRRGGRPTDAAVGAGKMRARRKCSGGPDEVYYEGLPVGSVFSFIWNGMISMSFQLVGFLLTYLLHTTHAAKNGSRAGLGITLVQYGFYMKGSGSAMTPPANGQDPQYSQPPDPNSHDFEHTLSQAQQARAQLVCESYFGSSAAARYLVARFICCENCLLT